MEILVALAVGLGLGGAAAWLALRGRAALEMERAQGAVAGELSTMRERAQSLSAQLEESRANIASREAALDGLRASLADESRHRAAAEESAMRLPGLVESLSASEAKASSLQAANSALSAQLAEERKNAEEKLLLLKQAEERLANAFRALSADALQKNNQSFLDLAAATFSRLQENARGELEKRSQAIGEIVKPVRETLSLVDVHLRELEQKRVQAYTQVSEQVRVLAEGQQKLQGETANLVRALRTPSVRGRWGEITLQRVVEIAGLIEYCDFTQQESTTTGEGATLRPDMVVKLPNGRQVVVDAKAPLAAYLDAIDAKSEDERLEKMRLHAVQVRDHFAKLSQKRYWEQFSPAPEFVVLFLPGESFFSAALEQDPSLIETGVGQRVILATPTTLIALLKAIAYGWQQEKAAQGAQVIADLGRELYERVRIFAEHFAKVGGSLDAAVRNYNQASSSLESRLLVTARRFPELGAGNEKEIPEVEPIERTARLPEAEE